MYLKSLVILHPAHKAKGNNYKSLTKHIDDLNGIFAAVSKKNKKLILENLLVTDYAAEGKALAKQDGKVIFISGAVPGDLADVLITKSKKDWAEGRVVKIKEYSGERVTPFCRHFGTCGGCKWQMLPYAKQLEYKQQEAIQNLKRIGRVVLPDPMPIVGGEDTVHYRNKLEFTFSNKRYLTNDEIGQAEILSQQNALGFHVPRIFDKVIDIQECFLMDDVNNLIRNTIREFALENNFSFYDIRGHTGWLRNVIIRLCTTGELMVNICLNHDAEEDREKLFDHLLKQVPSITTLLYTINPKWNDSIYDLTPQVYYGKGYAIEKLSAGPGGEDFQFKISPKSFFQTNTKQAEKLYTISRDFAGLTGKEIVYDLYCGTGSIGIFLSRFAKKIIGVEVIAEAIEDARENAALNNIGHAEFFTGDVIKICNDEFFAVHGRPDVIITDPPRAGMHEKLVIKLLEIAAPKIVYVSCNTATQARDIGLLGEKYSVEKVQPVDMFPHTHHIECVVLLKLK
ncbi:MAG TPA: 23S rRNA (uracil(1939)-C(5))-methyltransferase RlmD [Ferruginibacter sp.]|nr:23S rRNA (uracil(1939)-C(5))-methyltransferase RlmD [Ferruginibacter sp.]